MPTSQTQPTPVSTKDYGSILASHEGVKKAKAAKPESVKVEPTMRQLRNILGDVVLEIFPPGITENVDALYDLCKEDEEFWAAIPCETVQERNELLSLMKAYAECAGLKGYTVRQDRTAPPEVLRVRVTDRRGSGKDGESTESES